MTARRWLVVALAALAVTLLAGRALAQLYVDYRWFDAMGASEVWETRTMAIAALRIISGLIATFIVFVNLYVVRRSVASLVLPRRVANLEIGEEVPAHYLTAAAVVLAIVLGALLSLPQDDWSGLVLARRGVPFGESDPYLGLDLGFFVYWLPFESTVHTWTLISMLIITATVVFLYALTPSLRWDRGTLYISAYVRRHVTVLAGLLLLLLAWSYRLDMYTSLVYGSGAEGAYRYADHVVGIPGNLVLAVVTLGVALIVVWAGWTGQLRLAGGAMVAVLVLAMTVRNVAPWVVSRTDPATSAARERPYEATRAGYTRRAFAVDRILPADTVEAFGSLANASTAVSSWDAAAIVRAVERTRRVDISLTEIGWRATPAGLVAEIPERPAQPADPGRAPWTLTRVLAWAADADGAPIRVSATGAASAEETLLGTPLVFDSAAGYLVVTDSLDRVVGAKLDSWATRIAHAWSLQKPGLMFEEVPAYATVVIHRDLRRRLRTVAPFFAQGSTITPVILGDTLAWAVDLYSASDWYPLARHALIAQDQRSYFQHAATAIVYATTGRMLLVADSLPDPIAATWLREFPRLFTKWSALPPALRNALPPASDGLLAQAIAFGRYGTRTDSDSPKMPPSLDGADARLLGPEPPFALPGGEATAMATPLVSVSGDRVRGVLVATGGADRRTRWYPAPTAVGWNVMVDRLRGADTAAARASGGAMGPVRVVPIAGALAYLQSSYAWPVSEPPTLRKVSVVLGDSLRIAPSLGAFAAGGMPQVAGLPAVPTGDLREQVAALVQAMREALRRGDWAAFGRAFDQLGRLTGEHTR